MYPSKVQSRGLKLYVHNTEGTFLFWERPNVPWNYQKDVPSQEVNSKRAQLFEINKLSQRLLHQQNERQLREQQKIQYRRLTNNGRSAARMNLNGSLDLGH